MGYFYQTKDIDYNINKKEYKLLKKANKKVIVPLNEETKSLYRELLIKNFVEIVDTSNDVGYKTSSIGLIAMEKYKRECDNTASPKWANVISLIALGLSLASALLSIYSLYLQSLHP